MDDVSFNKMEIDVSILSRAANGSAVVRQLKQDVLNEVKKIETESFIVYADYIGNTSEIETNSKQNFESILSFEIGYKWQRWTL